ncbi:MAG: hypothetical protein PF961_12940 [Planctomycetota bacterium]|jgi:hypothetical protein|nr:hypothetical protein [Planctomycetota bacterium]
MYRALALLLPLAALFAVETSEPRTLHERSLSNFVAADKLKLHGKADSRPSKDAGWHLTLAASDKEYARAITRTKGQWMLRSPVALHIDATLTKGAQVGLAAILIDEEGEQFGLKNTPITSTNTATWRLPDDIGGTWGTKGDGKLTGKVRLERVLIVRWPDAQEATVHLHGMRVTEARMASESVTVGLNRDGPTPVVAPGGSAVFTLTNTSDQGLTLPWRLTAITETGEQQLDARDLELPAGATVSAAIPATTLEHHGVKRFAWQLGSSSGRQRLAVMALAGANPSFRDNFLFGCGGGNAELLAQIGIDLVRISSNWHDRLQRKQGTTINWDGKLEEVANAQAAGIEIVCLLGYTAGWATKAEYAEKYADDWRKRISSPPDPTVWQDWCTQIATTLGHGIRYWEVRNEVDLDPFGWVGTTEEYLETQRIAYQAIKAVNPELKVLTSGFATLADHGGRGSNHNIMERTVAEGADSYDYVGFHQHGTFGGVFQRIVDGELARILALAPGKQAFYTETAIISGDTWASELTQADELVKKVALARNRGARAYCWFVPVSNNWGLVRNDYQPKPAYLAYNNLVALTRSLQPAADLDLGPGRWGLRYHQRAGASTRQVLLFWHEDEARSDALVRVYVGSNAQCQLVDRDGNSNAVTVTQGSVVLAPGPHVAYLVIDGGDELRAAPAAVDPATLAPIVRGTVAQLGVTLSNTSNQTQRTELLLTPPPAMGLEPITAGTELAAGETKTLTIDMPIAADAALPVGASLTAMLDTTRGNHTQSLRIPLQVALVIPANAGSRANTERAPDLLLDRDNMVNYFAADPANADKVWTGPEDLSATVWFARDAEALTVTIAVTDDTFQQDHAGGQMWRGDGLQMALGVPEQNGHWEWGIYRTKKGNGACHIFSMPKDTGLENPWQLITADTVLGTGSIRYAVRIPLAALGLSPAALEHGIRFNMVINDSDRGPREGYVQVANGIARGKHMHDAPILRFAP